MDRALRIVLLFGALLRVSSAWAQAPDTTTGGTQQPPASFATPAEATTAATSAIAPEATAAPTLPGVEATTGATPRRQWWTPGSLAHADLYDIIRGPAFLAAWVVFAAGLLFRIVQFLTLTVRQDAARPVGEPRVSRPRTAGFAGRGAPAGDRPALDRGRSTAMRVVLAVRRWARATILGSNPVMAFVSLLFHLLLFLVPLLLPAHNIFFDLAFRVSLPTLGEPLLDACTLVVLLACAFFFLRRLAVARVRALTTARDWVALLLVSVPFTTAFLAYRQVLDYRIVLLTHMIAGELVIAAIPFSAIGHMPFILFARFFTAGEYAWGPGNRRWR